MISKLAIALGLTLLPVTAVSAPAMAKGGNCTTRSTTTIPVSSLPHTFTADGAGTVAVNKAPNFTLKVTKVTRNAGWRSEIERNNAREVEVTFQKSGNKVKFSAQREDGKVRGVVQVCS